MSWKPVVDYEDLYEVSSEGDVRSIKTKKFLSQSLNGRGNGYFKVNLHRNGIRKTRTVHQLVAEAFLGFCPVNHEVRHGIKGSRVNKVSNISYGTRSDNQLDRRRDGTNNSKPIVSSEGTVYFTLREAEELTGTDQSSINKVLRGHRKTAGA